jgi:hypothetical protein
MITLRCTLALSLRDARTGRALTRNAARALIDGQPCRTEYREGGYMVFVNLPQGQYVVELRGSGYLSRTFQAMVPFDGYEHRIVNLLPRGRALTETDEVVALDGGRYLISETAARMRLAQNEALPGDREAKVYARGGADFPALFLFAGAEGPELCEIEGLSGDTAAFARPLRESHKRGAALIQCAELE